MEINGELTLPAAAQLYTDTKDVFLLYEGTQAYNTSTFTTISWAQTGIKRLKIIIIPRASLSTLWFQFNSYTTGYNWTGITANTTFSNFGSLTNQAQFAIDSSYSADYFDQSIIDINLENSNNYLYFTSTSYELANNRMGFGGGARPSSTDTSLSSFKLKTNTNGSAYIKVLGYKN